MRCSIQNEIQNGEAESTKFTQLGERMEMYLLKSRSENTNSKYFIALTTILPILFLYLNTVTVTAGTFDP